jgi:hypothetical protein
LRVLSVLSSDWYGRPRPELAGRHKSGKTGHWEKNWAQATTHQPKQLRSRWRQT